MRPTRGNHKESTLPKARKGMSPYRNLLNQSQTWYTVGQHVSIPCDVQQTFDHVDKTLPGPVDNQNLNIVVNTHNKDKTKVFTALVDVNRVKAAIRSFISLGNPWYKDLKISDNNDLERIVVPIDNGM